MGRDGQVHQKNRTQNRPLPPGSIHGTLFSKTAHNDAVSSEVSTQRGATKGAPFLAANPAYGCTVIRYLATGWKSPATSPTAPSMLVGLDTVGAMYLTTRVYLSPGPTFRMTHST